METILAEVCEDGTKVDSHGRRIYTEEELERLMREYEGSGLTQKAYCKREGVRLHTFVSWLSNRRRKEGKVKSRRKPVFREVSLPVVSGKAGLLGVELAGGEILRGSDPEMLAKLVGLLRS